MLDGFAGEGEMVQVEGREGGEGSSSRPRWYPKTERLANLRGEGEGKIISSLVPATSKTSAQNSSYELAVGFFKVHFARDHCKKIGELFQRSNKFHIICNGGALLYVE